jgi:hypothetical protein
MTVTPLESKRAARQAGVAEAVRRHPSALAKALAAPVPAVDPAKALTVLCREWDTLTARFASGPGSLPPDEAEELMQHLCGSLTHPDALPSLVLALPGLRAAVDLLARVEVGEINPYDVDPTLRACDYDLAEQQAQHHVDVELWPLLHGLPIRDVCPRCVHTIDGPSRWQTRTGCTRHQRAL